MATPLHPNVFQSPEGYAAAEADWRKRWLDIVASAGATEDWDEPWVSTGHPDIQDGNPIFSAVNYRTGFAVRIIEEDPTDGDFELRAWRSTAVGFPEAQDTIEELVISCAPTMENMTSVLSYLSDWVERGEFVASRQVRVKGRSAATEDRRRTR